MSCDAIRSLARVTAQPRRWSPSAARPGRWSNIGACLVLGLLLPRAALAQPEPPSAQSATPSVDAKAEFTNAIKLYKADDAAGALPIFQRVADATKSPNAYLYVGHCLSKLGRYVEAHVAFSATLKAILAQPDEKYEATRQAALTQLAALSQRVAKLVVSLTETPPGLEVTVDGRPLEAAQLGTALVLEPGEHQVLARADGMQPVTRTITVQVGEEKTLAIALQPKDQPRSAPTPIEPASNGSGKTLKVIGFVAAGVGVAGLGAFTVTGLQAKGVYEDLKSACGGAGCSDAAHQSDIQRGKSLQTMANVGLAVGAAGVLSGGILLYLGYSKAAESSPTLAFSQQGAMVGYRARF